MTIDFLYVWGSPPCSTVAMVAKAIDLELNFKSVDLVAGEHLKPEFLKVNIYRPNPNYNCNHVF